MSDPADEDPKGIPPLTLAPGQEPFYQRIFGSGRGDDALQLQVRLKSSEMNPLGSLLTARSHLLLPSGSTDATLPCLANDAGSTTSLLRPEPAEVPRMASDEFSSSSSSSCAHTVNGADEGWCWGCHMEAGKADSQEHLKPQSFTKQQQRTAPTASQNRSTRRSSTGSNKTVRFDERVEVRETHAEEDYPGRSMLSKDSDDKDKIAHENTVLDRLLMQYQGRGERRWRSG